MSQSRHDPSSRRGFTLVELLMVILIITMLISLLVPAVNAARVRGIETSIQQQIEVLSVGLESFKTTYGAYPPDPNWSDAEVATFLRRAWPRYAWTQSDINQIKSLDHAEILVFWLGGRWDGAKMTGFNAELRANPFSAGAQRTQPFQFDETRLADVVPRNNNFPEYYPPNFRPSETRPFVYFAARPKETSNPTKSLYCAGNTTNVPIYVDPREPGPNPPYDLGYAVPYQIPSTQSGVKRFVKEESFQIICAGIDGHYGAGSVDRFYPDGRGFDLGDKDNLTNFAKTRLELGQ
jgi:prepilin-type N-terminal cleavage/methylation domain-containing protein